MNQLVHVSRRAMACEFEVCLPADQYARGAEAVLEALDLVQQLEAQLSVFRALSEISRINSAAAARGWKWSRGCFELLELAMRLCRRLAGRTT